MIGEGHGQFVPCGNDARTSRVAGLIVSDRIRSFEFVRFPTV